MQGTNYKVNEDFIQEKKAVYECGAIDVEIQKQICSLDNCLVSALK